MAVTRSNVLVGIGTFSVGGSDVGSTHGGVSIEKTQEVYEKKVDQKLDTIALYPIATKMEVKTNLAEATLENLAIAWNESTTIASSGTQRSLDGGIATSLTERAISFNGKSPEGYNRTYSFHKAVVYGASPHAIKKDDQVVFPITFRIIPDLDQVAGEEYYTITDYAE